jgi:hypothetical protein
MKEIINFVKTVLVLSTIVLAYVFANMAAVELFWNTKDSEQYQARVIFLSVMLFIISCFTLIVSYHILGDSGSTGVYNFVIYFYLFYMLLGNIYFFIIRPYINEQNINHTPRRS